EALARRLLERGYAVRATTRRPERVAELKSRGIEAAVADPDRLATLMPLFEGASALCWLMGSAAGPPEQIAALHGERLHALLETLVDTHVRGFVYERSRTADPALLERGSEIVRRAEERHRIRAAMIEERPDAHTSRSVT